MYTKPFAELVSVAATSVIMSSTEETTPMTTCADQSEAIWD